jgi:type IV secretory pathway VirB2 component (pilin)
MKQTMRTKEIRRGLAAVALLLLSSAVTFAQQPTHYPSGGEPVSPALINILIFIGGPLLLYLGYRYYRKKSGKK